MLPFDSQETPATVCQLTGLQFSTSSAIAGNNLNTLPDYPAEIRAPTNLNGVSVSKSTSRVAKAQHTAINRMCSLL